MYVYDAQGNVVEHWIDDGILMFETVGGTSRPITDDDRAARESQDQKVQELRKKAIVAIQNNLAFLNDDSVTTAEAVAQVKALTRQVNALIRLEVEALDTTEGS